MAFHQSIPEGTVRGHLRVLGKTGRKKGKYPFYQCECLFCGRKMERTSKELSPTKDHFCMECEESKNLFTHFVDITGEIFGDFQIIERVHLVLLKNLFIGNVNV